MTSDNAIGEHTSDGVTDDRTDVFLYRLLAGIACGLGVIIASWSSYLTFWFLPSTVAVFQDFGIALPWITRFVLWAFWLPFTVSAVSVGLSVFAAIRPRRTMLTWCWLSVLVSFAVVVICGIGVEVTWFGLIQSVQE